ncbi:hypothetical protein L1049_007499 [Liquidambar formosana]|uniref:Small auxin up regulated protein n=1 Tax=Liquidambar formosana TaxID=63359 RepID=A0AAP0X1I9_LIQFO
MTKKAGIHEKLAPSGFIPIYVGEESRRYVVPVACLSCTMFQALLHQFREEIQASIAGPIKLPCSPQMFEWVLKSCQG